MRKCNDTSRRMATLDWVAARRLLGDYRRRAGLSVVQLAKTIGVSKQTVYRIEDVGQRLTHEPQLDTLMNWIEGTGGSLEGFFC